LWGGGQEGAFMFFVELLVLFEDLFAEAEVCDFDDVVMDEDVFGFDVAVDDVEFVEVFEGVEDLFEVDQYICFFLYLLLEVEFGEVVVEIFVVAVLEDQVDSAVRGVSDDVLDFDYVGVLAQFDEGLYLLSCERDYLLDLSDFVDVVGDADDLEGQFVHFLFLLFFVEADVDATVGTCSQLELGFFCVVVVEGFYSFLVLVLGD
jgi:hypothetical protein